MSDATMNMVVPFSNRQSEMALTTIEGETRILDIDLAARLGFERPRDIRKLIARHESTLDAFGPRATVARVINGGEATETYLNRKQAIFITAKSETAEATEITIEIIERFDAYERGRLAPALDLTNPDHLLPLLAQYAVDKKALLAKVEEQAPKVQAFEQIADATGNVCLMTAGKTLGLPPKKFVKWCDDNDWTFTRGKDRRAHQNKIDDGYLVMKARPGTGENADRVFYQPMMTPKGLAKLAKYFAEHPFTKVA